MSVDITERVMIDKEICEDVQIVITDLAASLVPDGILGDKIKIIGIIEISAYSPAKREDRKLILSAGLYTNGKLISMEKCRNIEEIISRKACFNIDCYVDKGTGCDVEKIVIIPELHIKEY